MSETFFAPCPRGLEHLLAEELQACGASRVDITHGGVASEGDWAYAYRVNLESRLATRLLWKVGFTRYRSEEEIYRLASAVTWARSFDTINPIRINVTSIKSPLKSLNFVTLRIKDGICDHFRAIKGGRPDVDTVSPDMRIHAFLTEDTCTLYLDTSGEPLYKRGFKRAKVEASIKENLAAGILKLSGWLPGQTLLDPMCGSGTFLIEAAQMALDIAPGLGRSFAFEKFRHFDAELWQGIRKAAQQRQKQAPELPIFGADIDPRQIRSAEANLEAAGLAGKVELLVCDVLDLQAPDDAGVIVCNPPYGVRLSSGDELAEFYPKLGDALKRGFAGWNAYFITADLEMAKLIGLKASKRTPLMNGDLDCRVFEFKLVAGQNRERTQRLDG
ncbi:THUMP domain-containing protein [Uliginosibacterium sp. 31-16]|uniref:THUMP domain-containing class I SAM-dependent RNA methyltransferase n=1 Tax=Uliginosibacterium sp. 31-16 TaxID=3068315 RepID=UPI00273D2479|nr:THUMP domain-containing protein [Uliginosibacterium sp. 31-16]MDP5238104.1 THUMP domain-containing protein [Uliginosibacterium sp. 31-16]